MFPTKSRPPPLSSRCSCFSIQKCRRYMLVPIMLLFFGVWLTITHMYHQNRPIPSLEQRQVRFTQPPTRIPIVPPRPLRLNTAYPVCAHVGWTATDEIFPSTCASSKPFARLAAQTLSFLEDSTSCTRLRWRRCSMHTKESHGFVLPYVGYKHVDMEWRLLDRGDVVDAPFDCIEVECVAGGHNIRDILTQILPRSLPFLHTSQLAHLVQDGRIQPSQASMMQNRSSLLPPLHVVSIAVDGLSWQRLHALKQTERHITHNHRIYNRTHDVFKFCGTTGMRFDGVSDRAELFASTASSTSSPSHKLLRALKSRGYIIGMSETEEIYERAKIHPFNDEDEIRRQDYLVAQQKAEMVTTTRDGWRKFHPSDTFSEQLDEDARPSPWVDHTTYAAHIAAQSSGGTPGCVGQKSSHQAGFSFVHQLMSTYATNGQVMPIEWNELGTDNGESSTPLHPLSEHAHSVAAFISVGNGAHPDGQLDQDLVRLLRALEHMDSLHDTVLVIHGTHTDGRSSEINPLQLWLLPKWLSQAQPRAVEVFQASQQYPVNTLDMRETFVHLLDLYDQIASDYVDRLVPPPVDRPGFRGTRYQYQPSIGSTSALAHSVSHPISQFHRLPVERNCIEMSISDEVCRVLKLDWTLDYDETLLPSLHYESHFRGASDPDPHVPVAGSITHNMTVQEEFVLRWSVALTLATLNRVHSLMRFDADCLDQLQFHSFRSIETATPINSHSTWFRIHYNSVTWYHPRGAEWSRAIEPWKFVAVVYAQPLVNYTLSVLPLSPELSLFPTSLPRFTPKRRGDWCPEAVVHDSPGHWGLTWPPRLHPGDVKPRGSQMFDIVSNSFRRDRTFNDDRDACPNISAKEIEYCLCKVRLCGVDSKV